MTNTRESMPTLVPDKKPELEVDGEEMELDDFTATATDPQTTKSLPEWLEFGVPQSAERVFSYKNGMKYPALSPDEKVLYFGDTAGFGEVWAIDIDSVSQ